MSEVPSAKPSPSVSEANCEENVENQVERGLAGGWYESADENEQHTKDGSNQSDSPVSLHPVTESFAFSDPDTPSESNQDFYHK